MIRRIANLDVPVEAMREMFLLLAEQSEAYEDSRATANERMRRFRSKSGDDCVASPERHSDGHSDVNETPMKRHGDADVTLRARVSNNISNNLQVEPPVNKNTPPSPSQPEPDGFAEFWAAYPKRDGSADRKGAIKAFRAVLRRVDFTTLMAATHAFRRQMTDKGKIGTEFVPQARTWLNGDRWNEHGPDNGNATTASQAEALAFLEAHNAAVGERRHG